MTNTFTAPAEQFAGQRPETLPLGHEPVGVSLSTPLEMGFQVQVGDSQASVDVLARITHPDSQQQLMLYSFGDKKGQKYVGFGRVTGDEGSNYLPMLEGKTLAAIGTGKKTRATFTSRTWLKDSEVRLDVNPDGNEAVLHSTYGKISPEVAVADRAESLRLGQEADKRITKMNHDAWRRPSRIRKQAARIGLGLLAITTPHGPADMAMDALRSPAPVVREAAGHALDTKEKAATDRVTQLVEALDEGDNGFIKQQDEAFQAEYADELFSSEQVEGFKENIQAAETNDEVLVELNKFLAPYGLSANDDAEGMHSTSMSESNHGKLQKLAKQLVDTVSLFPQSEFSNLFEVENFVFAKGAKTGGEFVNGFAARSTVVYSTGKIGVIGNVPDFTNEIFAENVVDHEISHTMYNDHIERRWSKLAPLEFIAGRAMNYPEHASIYSMFGRADENQADVGAELLRDGIIHPDRGVAFESPVSKEILNILVELDAKLPGIAAHLINKYDTDEGNIVTDLPNQATERLVAGLVFATLLRRNRKPKHKNYSSRLS